MLAFSFSLSGHTSLPQIDISVAFLFNSNVGCVYAQYNKPAGPKGAEGSDDYIFMHHNFECLFPGWAPAWHRERLGF